MFHVDCDILAKPCMAWECKPEKKIKMEILQKADNLSEFDDQTCNICKNVFATKFKLQEHQSAFHGQKTYVCEICQKLYGSKLSLAKHLKVHSPYKCDKCKVSFSKNSKLMLHIEYVHEKKSPFKCNVCNKLYASLPMLKKHQVMHSNVSFVCKLCNFSFRRKEYLFRHARIHLDTKAFKCDTCQKTFHRLEHLNKHQTTHTGEKIKCDVCDKMLASYSHPEHMRIHKKQSIRNYHCSICEKAFWNPAQLRNHMLVHTNIRKFCCNVCSKKFKLQSHIITHMRSHGMLKPFVCDHCGFRSAYPSTMKRHIQHHEEQKTWDFECPMQDGGIEFWTTGYIHCSVRAKTAQDLDYHIARNHTKEGIASKLHSEQKLADFLTSQHVVFTRDWMNHIQFKNCANIEGNKTSARFDFFLPTESARLEANVIIENDEYAHRDYTCDSQRIVNITHAIQQTKESHDVRVLCIRFNPHHFRKDGHLFSHKLEEVHQKLLTTLQSLTKDDLHDGLNLVYINYDSTNGVLDIFGKEDSNYPKWFQDCVIRQL